MNTTELSVVLEKIRDQSLQDTLTTPNRPVSKLRNWFEKLNQRLRRTETTYRRTSEQYFESVQAISALEPLLQQLSTEELSQLSLQLKLKLQELATTGDQTSVIETQDSALRTLEEYLFALVREASRRFAGLRQYDVQIMGGLMLLDQTIVEMKTGEGKTITALLPLYAHALLGQGAHLLTSNEYLAKRDGSLAGKILHPLGVTIGCIASNKQSYIYDPDFVSQDTTNEEVRYWRPCSRQEAYQADITYGERSEFGFDYLRDQKIMRGADRVQRGHSFIIVDEVDNILIDEAVNPLILSETRREMNTSRSYKTLLPYLRNLTENTAEPDFPHNGHYVIDRKTRSIWLTELGWDQLEQRLSNAIGTPPEQLYQVGSQTGQVPDLLIAIAPLLKALYLYEKDRDYKVIDGQVVLLDQSTGRLMYGRRVSDGIHEAIEAKEKVTIQAETVTTGMTSLQLYIRQYLRKAGMTGTGMESAEEFEKIYNLTVADLPTHVEYAVATGALPLNETTLDTKHGIVECFVSADAPELPVFFRHKSLPDVFCFTYKEKVGAILQEIATVHATQRPILVGTTSDKMAYELSSLLETMGIQHTVLSGDKHMEEAHIISLAGKKSAVTISTNMAGRGVDIQLGGNTEQQLAMALNDLIPDQDSVPMEVIISLVSAFLTNDQQTFENLCTSHQLNLSEVTNLLKNSQLQISQEKVFVRQAGGLHVIGCERQLSRRADLQLSGRASRQGDPGSSKFFVSLEDALFSRFGNFSLINKMRRLFAIDGNTLAGPAISTLTESLQSKAEASHFEQRKLLLTYDLILQKQQKLKNHIRNTVLEASTEQMLSYIQAQFDITKARNGSFKTITTNELSTVFHEQNNMEMLRGQLLQAIDTEWENFLSAIGDFRKHLNSQHLRIPMYTKLTHQAFLELQQDVAHSTAQKVSKLYALHKRVLQYAIPQP